MRFILAILLFVSMAAHSATSVGALEPTTGTWRAYRGASFATLVCSNSSEAALLACIAADSERRVVTTRYQLRYPNRYVTVTYTRPTCAPPRAPETQQVACPNNPERLFTQTRTWTVAPYPTCEIAGAWLPATPSATDCPPIQLPAPTGVQAAAVSTSEIRVQWNVVPDAVAYSLRRCIGATCDPLSVSRLLCTQSLTANHVTLGAGVTVRYQVEAARTSDCSGTLSNPSTPVVSATTFTTTPDPEPEQPPTACTGLVCEVSWTHDGPAADGFRVVFGASSNELVRSVQVVPGSVRRTTVTMPAPGVWHFGCLAYIGANTSPVSNIIVRTVQ